MPFHQSTQAIPSTAIGKIQETQSVSGSACEFALAIHTLQIFEPEALILIAQQ
jgi:hypothetical protein